MPTLLPRGLDQLEARARERLSASAFAYFADVAYAGADRRDASAAAHVEAWRRFHLRPRVLVNVRDVRTAGRVLATDLRFPILAAPCAYNAFAHPDAEIAVARATAAAGTVPVVSSASSVPLERIADASSGPKWFQLYAEADRSVTEERVRRAEDAGCEALVLTVDAPVGGERYHGYPEQGFGPIAHAAALNPTLDWPEVERLAARTSLPLVLKGILHPADVEPAVQHGARGVIVSSHGGRQLEGVLPTPLALPDIAEAARGRLEVLVDGGIRSGRDVLRALALGARAVLVGRPYLWALAVGGEDGVRELFERLHEELRSALALTGQADAASVDPSVVVRS